MRIGVISDTHDSRDAVLEACRVLKSRSVELVLHLGDIVAPFTLRWFKECGVEKLVAVYGNNCGERLGLARVAAELGYEIKEPPYLLEVAGRRILMVHGWGSPRKTIETVTSLAASGRYDAVLYGHTHRVHVERVGSTLVLNPGEACGYLTGRRTLAILDTDTMEAEVVQF